MDILPSIDLLGGSVVRLRQGDYSRVTVYGDDPVSVARAYRDEGATWLHVVDLDGAAGRPGVLTEVIPALLPLGLKLQVGGGIRDLRLAEKLLTLGASRLMIGTALFDEAFFAGLTRSFDLSKITAAVDVKGDKVAIRGWSEVSGTGPDALCEKLFSAGITHVLCTDAGRDGTELGPNVALCARLIRPGLYLMAAGGIGSIGDLVALSGAGVQAAVVGRALYAGRFTLNEALSAC